MGSGYAAQRTGTDAIVQKFKSIQVEQAAMRKRLTALGVQVDPATDSIVLPHGRTLRIYDESDNLIQTIGGDASDSSAGLKVLDESGNLIGFLGQAAGGTGLEVHRPDGSLSFLANTSYSGGYVGAFDRGGNAVVTDDIDSGQGLARPYIPLAAFVDTSAPTQTTTSSTFVQIATASGYKQHPKVHAWVLVHSSAADTTGEVQLVDASGTQIGTTATIAASTLTAVEIGPADIAGAHEQLVTIDIQIRRTAGTGTIGARGIALWGVESA